MPSRVTAVTTLLRSPLRILSVVLLLVFAAEVAVMFVLPHIMPESYGEAWKAILDAVLLTLVCAPALWWVLIAPLRRVAIQEHQRSQTIVANASEGIVTFDSDGTVISGNRAALELFQMDALELIGKTVRLAIPNLPLSFSELPGEFRLDAVRPNGSRFPVQVSVSEYPSETQELRIAIIRDLTDTQRAEEERLLMARQTEALRAQQMATLAQLATGVAHEIRNPLTSIKMLIQVNRSKFAEEGLPTDDLELVEHEIRRMEQSVNSLLDYARPEQGEFTKFAFQDTLRKAVQLIEGRCESQKVRLSVDVPSTPLLVEGDASQIQQLLLNLTLNALDAMPGGGELRIVADRAEGKVQIKVLDTGAGIDPTVLGKLFSPFVTTKPNGVGLGLGICRRIAESHRGELIGVNRIPHGAEFRLTLPCQNASLDHANQSQDSEDDAKVASHR
ncbi:sensor histidine kinase [Roseiconus nitratireducens]|nr:ATP-binding protein [Roseiconus nitratireducens]